MPHLTIKGEDFQARTDFKFERMANDKYNTEEDGQKIGGFMSIYLRLLQFENEAIVQFWDCALAHYKKDKPIVEDIEEALYSRIEQDGDTEKLLQEAFTTLDKSGFFLKRVKSIWKDFAATPETKKNETEEQKVAREEQEQTAKIMQDRRSELLL